MSDGLFSNVELGNSGLPGYRLHSLELFNWGTFDKHVWHFEPDGQTSLVTGDIGSGKSTLVDALTTLLLPAHRIAYNRAAGAELKERTLRSYVEGHYKSERIEASGRSRAVGLREGGKTYSVILGVFRNDGHDETVTLAQVFQQRHLNTPYRFFVTATKPLTVRDDFTDFGTDLNDLRRRLRASGAEIFDDYPKFAIPMRRLLGIRSAQALELFHQTVSMKSVGNLNAFVRNHMLEPADATERVRGIINHFEDLTKAHDAVRRAREQLTALTPVVETSHKYDETLAQRNGQESQRAAVTLFIAETRAELLRTEITALAARVDRSRQQAEAADREQAGLRLERDALRDQIARAGGDRIGELEKVATRARQESEERRRRRARFDDALTSAIPDAFGTITDDATFEALLASLPDREAAVLIERDSQQAATTALAGELTALDQQVTETRAELASLESRTSNLPRVHTELRTQLCTSLGLGEDELPFAGELLDVTAEHHEWRGATERVLRGFALSLLVPTEHYEAVSEWVNSRRLEHRRDDGSVHGARLVYQRVAPRRVRVQREPSEHLLLADCLDVREGSFEEYLREELVRRANYQCVDTVAQLRTAPRAVTRQGQIRSGDRHEKDDRTRVTDARTWVLGWANERKIAALREELTTHEEKRATAQERLGSLHAEYRRLSDVSTALSRLADFTTWAELDPAEADARARAADDERERLLAGSSVLVELETSVTETERRIREAEERRTEIERTITLAQRDHTEGTQQLTSDEQTLADRPEAEVSSAREAYPGLRERLGSSAPTTSAACAAAQAELTSELTASIEHLGRQLNAHTTNLHQAMNAVLTRWPELRSDLDAHVDTRGDFLTFHERVATDDLPRHEAEFKRLLNTETIRELAQFNSWLRRQADEIGTRVDQINEALGAIPYNPGRYIKLERERTDNQEIKQFRTDLRSATDDTIGADADLYSEQRFEDVKAIIERFRGREGYAESDKSWTRRVTDVRNWFVFSASERDIETDAEWEHYSDSDGKSGGQKEKLAYTILAASLAYQYRLEWGAGKSKDFRFVVIDEAFGRGSDVSTRYALDLFAKLGLQLLIVTPLQKVHVIEPYVKAIGYVANPAGTASHLHTMTIDEYRERREGAPR